MSCLLIAQGRIGKFDKKVSANNVTILKISVASSNEEKDKEGKPKTEWTEFTAMGKQADAIFNFAKKGDMVSVIARKSTNKITGQDGTNRYFTNYNIINGYEGFQVLQRAQRDANSSGSGNDSSSHTSHETHETHESYDREDRSEKESHATKNTEDEEFDVEIDKPSNRQDDSKDDDTDMDDVIPDISMGYAPSRSQTSKRNKNQPFADEIPD